MSNVDLNVDNYTVSELLTILGLDTPDVKSIQKECDILIHRFQIENNPNMVAFFQNVEDKLTQYAENLENSYDEPVEYEPSKKQTDNWIHNQYLTQKNQIQNDKITDRKQKIDVYNNTHVPMKREQLGVNNNFSVEVAQDILNPNLKNVTSRVINIDSQYRQSNSINNISTDFTLDLSESILNVISLRLYSYQIPYSWYAFDIQYSNTCFWITFTDSTGKPIELPVTNSITNQITNQFGVPINIEPGNYTAANAAVLGSLPNAITNAFTNAGFTGFTEANPVVSIQPYNNKLTLFLNGLTYTNPTTSEQYIVSSSTIITFFDPTAQLVCSNTCAQPLAINQSLGWSMGFRFPSEPVNINGNTGSAVLDLYGPRYLILVIDDYNQNHINNGLIGITEYSNVLKLPSYYSPDLPYTCIPADPSGTNLIVNSQILKNDENAGTLLMDKYNATYEKIPQVLPSAPRTLTQTQIYTINEILKNNGKTSNYKLTSPTTPDTFALIPIKHSGLRTGETIVEFGGTLQDNKRVYFGPVNIERMHVKLLDDKGNVLNLNGSDWSVTLISENLYQY
jgi:hypothetical protein